MRPVESLTREQEIVNRKEEPGTRNPYALCPMLYTP